GVPSYGAGDILELVGLANGGELVPIGPDAYRVEGQGHGIVVQGLDGGFVVTDADGRQYRIGTTAAGRKASGSRVAAWYLERVTEQSGARIDYSYLKDRGEVY